MFGILQQVKREAWKNAWLPLLEFCTLVFFQQQEWKVFGRINSCLFKVDTQISQTLSNPKVCNQVIELEGNEGSTPLILRLRDLLNQKVNETMGWLD